MRVFLKIALMTAVAFGLPEELWKRVAHGPETLALFREIARVYRPSRGEGAIRELLKRWADEARLRVWGKGEVTWEQDTTGNLLIRVPGTGHFTDRKAIALQAHLDMVTVTSDPVIAVVDAFKRGVDVVEKDGWLASRDSRTTLGADDGIGLALAFDYVLNPRLEHPPLELVFTVDEEDGMTGAANFALPLKAAAMINLDWDSDAEIGYGCTGAEVVDASGTLRANKVRAGSPELVVRVSGLPGGHSAVNIHEDRPNAVLVGAALLKVLFKSRHDVRLTRLIPSKSSASNVIPSEFSFAVTGLSSSLQLAREDVSREFARVQASGTPGVKSATLSFAEGTTSAGTMSLDSGVAAKIASMPAAFHWTRGTPRAESEDWVTSSNLSALALDRGRLSLQYMLRAYERPEGLRASREAVAALKAAWPRGRPTVSSTGLSEPWTADTSSFAYRAARKANPEIKFVRAAGGLESRAFQARYPRLPIMSYGVNILDMHTVTERLEIESVARAAKFLNRTLVEMGRMPELATRPTSTP